MVKRFEDVLDIINGKNQKKVENPNGAYPIYGSGGVMGYADDYICGANTVVIGRKGSINNPIYVEEPFWNVDTAFGLVARENVLLSKYLYFFCVYYDFDKLNTTVTIPSLTKTNLLKIEIDVPSIDEQEKIIDKLNSIMKLIQFQREQIKQYDFLIKSRFVEMFGTLDNPTQSFSRDFLRNLCTKITDGKHGGCETEKGTGRYFVGAREIYDGKIHYDTAPEIKVAEFEKDYKRCNIEKGDFLIVNTGATIGKSAIAVDFRTEYTLLQKSVALLKVKRELLNPVYLQWCYRINTKMYMVESASAQPNLLLSKISATEIYVPDIEFQKQFATFVHQIEKLKAVAQKRLEKTQLLFDSLMQQYFG